MANRAFTQFAKTLVKEKVTLFARVTFGASGAPTLDAVSSKGIKSVTRNSAGKYTVVLGSAVGVDVYPKLFSVQVMKLNATAPAAPLVYVVSEQVASATAPQFVIQFTAVDGTTATDPASGEEVRLVVELSNSTAQ